mgnify:FL=1
MKLTDSKKRLLFEFIRYCVVGGTAFLVETATHWLLWKFVFTDTQSGVNIFIVTTIGFLVGLAVNYILSVVWVFTTEKQQKQGKTVKAFIIFALIGLVGYGIKVLLMYLGALCFGISYSDFSAETVPLQYYATHIISAGIVLVWNYIGRKVIIFRK